jgi:SAM-dependent methyltransferase
MKDKSLLSLSYSVHTRLREFHLRKLMPEPGQGRFLEVGCGLGYLTHVLGDGFVRVGLDTDLQALKLNYERGHKNVTLGDSTRLPFKSESFDVILCSEVLEHLPDGMDEKTLGEMARTLKPGGRLLITVPSLEGVRATSKLRNLGHEDPTGGEYHYRMGYAWNDIKAMIARIHSLRTIKRFYSMFLFAELFMDLLKWVFYRKKSLREQSDLSSVSDSKLFHVYRWFFPVLHSLFLVEDLILASIFKGHILILELERVDA